MTTQFHGWTKEKLATECLVQRLPTEWLTRAKLLAQLLPQESDRAADVTEPCASSPLLLVAIPGAMHLATAVRPARQSQP
ncbi:hypothetical protein FKM82_002790 [Ascaphus truei]